jgi:hypothetical protein
MQKNFTVHSLQKSECWCFISKYFAIKRLNKAGNQGEECNVTKNNTRFILLAIIICILQADVLAANDNQERLGDNPPPAENMPFFPVDNVEDSHNQINQTLITLPNVDPPCNLV